LGPLVVGGGGVLAAAAALLVFLGQGGDASPSLLPATPDAAAEPEVVLVGADLLQAFATPTEVSEDEPDEPAKGPLQESGPVSTAGARVASTDTQEDRWPAAPEVPDDGLVPETKKALAPVEIQGAENAPDEDQNDLLSPVTPEPESEPTEPRPPPPQTSPASSLRATETRATAEAPGPRVSESAGRRGHPERSAPWTYLLDLSGDYSQATSLAARAKADGIPAYVAEVPVAEGRVVYRVYAGAFADEHEAAALGVLLEAAGYATRLTERVGQPTR
jgi:hypothetical protein